MANRIINVSVLSVLVMSLLISTRIYAHNKTLVILHTNDMHARVMGVKNDDSMCSLEERDSEACFGGFDRIASQVAIERRLNPNTVLLDAGDQFQGSIFHLMYHGQASAKLMNMIGYQGMAIGNHEFDNGPAVLGHFANTTRFPMLSANIDASKSPELKNKIKPYTIIQQNGMRIGVLGYTTEDTAFLSSPGPTIRFLPVIDSVKKAVLALKKAKVDVIIAVSHSGLNQDIEVAKKVSGIAVIISGHTNSLLANHAKNADGPSPLVVMSPQKMPTLLVSAYAYGKFLGKLSFSFDVQGTPVSWAGEPILLDQSIKPDVIIRKEIETLYQPIKALQQKSVGFSPVDIDGQSCRFKECTFGNLVADAMLEYSRPFGVSIALMNGGGIRASTTKGDITYAQLQDVMPFDKTLVLYRLNGSVIKNILEHGVAFVEDPKNSNTGRFLQVSGLRYSFDPTKPRGKRIKEVFIALNKSQWAKLDLTKTYGVVTNSYMAQGGDNYTHFIRPEERWHVRLELKDVLSQFFLSSLSSLPKREGRIVNLADAATPNPPCALAFRSLIDKS